MARRINRILVAISLIFIILVCLPVVYTLTTALLSNPDLKIDLQAVYSSQTLGILVKSIFVAFSVAVLSSILGSALALLLYKTDLYSRKIFRLLFLIPLFLPPYIWAVAWQDFFQMFSGHALSAKIWTVIFVETLIFMPLAIIITGQALQQINAELEEAALLETNLKNVIFKIVLGLIKPAILTAFVLIFIFSLSQFSIPAYFNVKVFTTEIFTEFSAFYRYSLAILQSFLLVFLSLILLWTERKSLQDAAFLSIGKSGNRFKIYELKSYGNLVFMAVLILFLGLILLPVAVLFYQSFSQGTADFFKAFQLLQSSFLNSVFLAFVGSLLSLIIGFTASYPLWQSRFKNSFFSLFNIVLLVLFAMPSVVFGISLIKFYNRTWLNFIYGSSLIILIGFVGKFSFIAAKIIGNAIKQIPFSLDEAAQIEGVSVFKRIYKILFPIILPALFAAFMINFIFSFNEIATTIMVNPPGSSLLPVKVFTRMANATQSLTASLSLIVFLVTLLIVSVFYMIYQALNRQFDHADD